MYIILILLISYFIGTISTSYIVAKRMSGKDIRTMGSGNAGTSNVLRNLGKKAGAITFAGDVLKGVLAVVIAILISKYTGSDIGLLKLFAVIGVVCGHNWPVHMGFKGGKGVATSLGAMLVVSPVVTLTSLLLFIIIVILTKYISLGSVVSITLSPLFSLMYHKPRLYTFACVFLALVTIFSHRQNIIRLINGNERKLGQKG